MLQGLTIGVKAENEGVHLQALLPLKHEHTCNCAHGPKSDVRHLLREACAWQRRCRYQFAPVSNELELIAWKH